MYNCLSSLNLSFSCVRLAQPIYLFYLFLRNNFLVIVYFWVDINDFLFLCFWFFENKLRTAVNTGKMILLTIV